MTSKRFVIHGGMHKAGSTAIQDVLPTLEMGSTEYLDLGAGNHSAFLATAFLDKPENYAGHALNRRSPEEVLKAAEASKRLLGEKIQASNKDQLVLSAENLCLPGSSGLLGNLNAFLRDFSSDIRVVLYVRPPVEYIHSAFQQKVKDGMSRFNLAACYPNYRGRLGQFDDVFGRENVELRLFVPDRLVGRDAVSDFLEVLGESCPFVPSRSNESLSLEATALIYYYRTLNPETKKYPGAVKHNKEFVSAFFGLGSEKLAFEPGLISGLLDKNKDDLAWISRRMAGSVPVTVRESGSYIGSEDDLVAVAKENSDLLGCALSRMLADKSLPAIAMPPAFRVLQAVCRSE